MQTRGVWIPKQRWCQRVKEALHLIHAGEVAGFVVGHKRESARGLRGLPACTVEGNPREEDFIRRWDGLVRLCSLDGYEHTVKDLLLRKKPGMEVD